MATAMIGTRSWTRLQELGRGASGAVVFLAADDSSGDLFVVKSVREGHVEGAVMQLQREWSFMSALSSPHVLKCLGFGSGLTSAADRARGEHQLFLEFAPGGSVADVVARNGGRLEEGAIRAFAADVLMGLDYLHRRLVVHGDVKGSNVVVGADGRAKLADFGCARPAGDAEQPFGGTPAFMAPEVVRGEEQGPAADVWALGCTVIEMATGRAPWGDSDNVLAALRRIGFTDAVPEVPSWLSPEAQDFVERCLRRRACDRSTAAQLLEHPFVAASCGCKKDEAKCTWVSPTSALDAAFWESESDVEEDDMWSRAGCRIKSMACSRRELPDWDSDEMWSEISSNSSGNFVDAAANGVALQCPAKRIRQLACPPSSVPDWESDEGWIDVFSGSSSNVRCVAATDRLSGGSAKRVRELACPPSSLPDWESDEGWIDVHSNNSGDSRYIGFKDVQLGGSENWHARHRLCRRICTPTKVGSKFSINR